MTREAELRAALAPRRPKAAVTPVLKASVDEPWSYPDAIEAVDARSRGACECGRGCGLPGNVHHHIAGRGGANPHHPANLLHLNDQCHRWLHDHPVQAYDLGLMRKRNR